MAGPAECVLLCDIIITTVRTKYRALYLYHKECQAVYFLSVNINTFVIRMGRQYTRSYHWVWRRLLIGTVPGNNSLLIGTVPGNNSLLIGTVPGNNSLLTGTVPVNNLLLTGTVPVNNLLLTGTGPCQ